MERLTLEHVLSLIEREEYVVTEQYVQCILTVGEAPVIGTSYRFSKATHDPERAKKAAHDDAIRQLFSLEAYHQKRIRVHTDQLEIHTVEQTDGSEKIVNIQVANIGGKEHIHSGTSEPGI